MFLRETFCMKPCVVSTLGKTFTCQSSDPPWVAVWISSEQTNEGNELQEPSAD